MSIPTLRFRFQPDTPRLRARVYPAIPPLQATFRSNGTYLQYRLGEDGGWQDIIQLSDLAGPVATIVPGNGINVDTTDLANPVVEVEANLQEWNTVDPSADGKAIVAAEDYAAMRELAAIPTYVATRDELKALDTAKDTVAHLLDAGREGVFVFRAGNYSALVASDPAEGLYIESNDTAASSGAWVRQGDWAFSGISVSWFGAVGDGTTDDSAAIQAALNALTPGAVLLFDAKEYLVGDLIVPDVLGVELSGPVDAKSASPSYGLSTKLKAKSGASFVMASAKYVQSNVYANGPQSFRRITFDGAGIADNGLIVVGYANSVKECSFINAVEDGLLVTVIHQDGTQGLSVVENTIEQNLFVSNGRDGCRIERSSAGNVTDWYFINNFSAENGGDGLHTNSTAGATIGPSNHLYSNDGWDLNCQQVALGLKIHDNIFEANGTVSMTVNGSSESLPAAILLENFVANYGQLDLNHNYIGGIVWNRSTAAGTVVNSASNVFNSGGTGKAGFLVADSSNNLTVVTADVFFETTPFRSEASSGAGKILANGAIYVPDKATFSGPLTDPFTRTRDTLQEGTHTPIITASSGTLTTTSGTLKWTRVGKTIHCTIDLTLTAIGTGSGTALFTLPQTAADTSWGGYGQEVVNTGKGVAIAPWDSSKGSVKFYDGNSLIADGARVVGSFSYRV